MGYFTHWEPQLDWGEQFFVLMLAFPVIIVVVGFLFFWASYSHRRDRRPG
jgi:cytochrome c-type biogenesis protein CcmH/NrfF